MSGLLEWARRYAAAGISTMPIGDDKKPLGEVDASAEGCPVR